MLSRCNQWLLHHWAHVLLENKINIGLRDMRILHKGTGQLSLETQGKCRILRGFSPISLIGEQTGGISMNSCDQSCTDRHKSNNIQRCTGVFEVL